MQWEWDVFISHASEDKESVARPLAAILRELGCRVWFDEAELKLGDSLRAKIDSGLAKSRYGVVVLSPAFFSKDWPQRELNGLAARESASTKVLLPVWHGVDHDFVKKYSPTLADKLAVSTELGLRRVAEQIAAAIRDDTRGIATPSAVQPPKESISGHTGGPQPSRLKKHSPMFILASSALLAGGLWLASILHQSSVSQRKGPPSLPARMVSDPAISVYERNEKKDRVIVFVHGIFGSAKDTWTCPRGNFYWPTALLSDPAFADSDVYVAAYESPFVGNSMTIDELVSSLLNRFQSDHVFGHREVVFVAHSLGGLVVQRFLLTHRDFAKQVPFIVFYSTPESGAQIARLAHIFSSDPLLKEMLPGDQNDYLLNLENEWIAARFSIKGYCAYEKLATKGLPVVDRLSGTRNCTDNTPIPINKNHIDIVKPCNTQDDAYVFLKNIVSDNPIAPKGPPPVPRDAEPYLQIDSTVNEPKKLNIELYNSGKVDIRVNTIRAYVAGKYVRQGERGSTGLPILEALHVRDSRIFWNWYTGSLSPGQHQPIWWVEPEDATGEAVERFKSLIANLGLEVCYCVPRGQCRWVGFNRPAPTGSCVSNSDTSVDIPRPAPCTTPPALSQKLIADFAAPNPVRAIDSQSFMFASKIEGQAADLWHWKPERPSDVQYGAYILKTRSDREVQWLYLVFKCTHGYWQLSEDSIAK